MDFLHSRKWLNGDQYFRVDCDTQANVLLMDDINFAAYKRGDSYRYYGGFFKRFPAILSPPYPGFWNLTLDIDGARATIRYSIVVGTVPTALPAEPSFEERPTGWEHPPAPEGEHPVA